MSRLHAVAGAGEANREAIAADRVLEGAPVAETRLDFERDEKTFAGEWSADVGAWRVQYEEWEFCHLLEGECELIPDGGTARRFTAGDSFVIEPGFTGIWRVLAPMKKRFFVRLD